MSHNHMGTSPSGQDNDQMKIFTKNVGDFFIRLIANKKGEYNYTVYEFDRNLVTEEAPCEIVTEDDDELAKEVKDIVKLNVKELTYSTGKYHYPSHGGGYGNYSYDGEYNFWDYDEKSGTFVKKGAEKTKEASSEKAPIGFGRADYSRRGWGQGYDYFD